MSAQSGQKPAERHYPEKLRAKIDSGETGDKVAASDPALAPLGTDAEAGGHRPTTQETEIALKEKTRFASTKPTGPEMAAGAQLVGSNTKKAVVTFAFSSVLIFVALVAIYAYWPR
jgi:hypothetical protein